MEKQKKSAEKFDWTLSLLLLLFCLVSCFAIYSAQSTGQYSENYFFRQLFWYVVGAGIIATVMYFDSDQYKKMTWFLYGFGVLLLVGLILAPESIAPVRNGAKNWFLIPKIGTIQPSEFVKIFLILALSKVICSHYEKYVTKTFKTDLVLFIKLGITTFIPLALIIKEDLGTALVIIAIFTGIILASGITWKIILTVYGMGAAFAGTILYFVIWDPQVLEKYLNIKPYQFYRIYSWLDPDQYQNGHGYHLYNSLRAIGSGLITGKGFGERKVYLPELHTDFIFSVIGEEYGFVGASIVIGLFFILIYHLTKTALDTNDPFNTYICAGVISMITFHVFQNIGMTIQVLPITGIPLPFISYGGSSLMGNMFAMGLIFSMRYHHKTYMFGTNSK